MNIHHIRCRQFPILTCFAFRSRVLIFEFELTCRDWLTFFLIYCTVWTGRSRGSRIIGWTIEGPYIPNWRRSRSKQRTTKNDVSTLASSVLVPFDPVPNPAEVPYFKLYLTGPQDYELFARFGRYMDRTVKCLKTTDIDDWRTLEYDSHLPILASAWNYWLHSFHVVLP